MKKYLKPRIYHQALTMHWMLSTIEIRIDLFEIDGDQEMKSDTLKGLQIINKHLWKMILNRKI